ncbi:MAG: amino acid adenylation domain-containing protein [Moorea sp. SIO2I5]|nr:amino acid adenylation domain-containing protein [Moorena sp. SIO2I5]
MNLVKFLQDLSLKGVRLWIDGEKFRMEGSQEILTPELISKLKQHKTKILQLLKEQPDILQVYPLSYGQKGLRFLWELEPDSYTYNLSFAIRIYYQVNLVTWQETFEVLRKRHPMLRTTFPKLGQELIQRIHENQQLDFLQIDACGWSQDELYTKVLKAHRYPFDLETQPVMRVRWFSISAQNHVMLLTIHHIALDGWSANLIIKELPEIYQSLQTGSEISLSKINGSYQDYVNWQNKLLESRKIDSLWSYWKQKLSGKLPVLNLLTDRPRPQIQTFNGAAYHFKLSEELTRRLKELAQEQEVTLYTTLLATFQILLYRYTAQEDILVGTPTSGRTRPEFAPVVGYFTDQVVMRTDLSENPRFIDLLIQVSKTVIDALDNQDYPFSLLVQRLHLEQDSSHHPLFQAYFLLQKYQESQNLQKLAFSRTKTLVYWGGLQVEPFVLDQYEGLFDLTLEMVEIDSCMLALIKYNTNLFDELTIARMASNYQVLLEGIINNPQQRVGQLTLLTDTQQQLLVEWNNTTTKYPQDKCIHQLFEKQVEQTPDAVAVIFGQESLTYAELNQQANQLAHYLQSLGVKPETLVGLCVDRSLEMMVGLLGTLKAGGAYIPIDPSYPQQRVAYMLEDAAVSILLTTESLLELIPKHQAQTVCLDRDLQAISLNSQENPAINVSPQNLAYVIYTSGSTGNPKGVQIQHQSLVNFLVSMNSYLKLTNLDTLNSVTTISFDIAALELYLPLIVGASVIIVSREIAMDGNRLLPQLLQSGATVMQATPATWKMLLNSGLSNHKLEIKLLSGGEALPTQLASHLLEIGKEVWNLYGPTEATIWSTLKKVENQLKQTEDSNVVTSIGRPIANTKIYILDSYLQPVPIGVPGELHIGGMGLARGYLNRPELTIEKFIPNPFEDSEGQSSRLYKTGDLARYLPDGNIDYLGRIDNQVKIRGFRIELGEIESTLNKHPGVQESVVIAHPDRLNEKQLVAYVIPDLDNQSPSEQLSTSQLSLWQKVWDNTYKETTVAEDPKFNIVGWRDSYTGQSIPEQEMRQWLDSTVERILSLKPARVLEIGCGTGMLLFQIAPHSSKYYGTDISEKSIFYIESQLKTLEGNWSHVKLHNLPAHNLQALDTETFDTIILNSVVQYFPSIEYLVGVLEKVVKLVEPGGFIFVGDVRNLRSLETFHTDIIMSQVPDNLPVEDLWQRVQKKLTEEEELAIDPGFFKALQQYLPEISQVEIHLKRSRANNEMTKFRYDVIIQVVTESLPILEPQILKWQQDNLKLLSIHHNLAEKQPKVLSIKEVPNARLQTEIKLNKLLTRKDDFVSIGEMRKGLAKISLASGVEPEDFWRLGDELGYNTYITWSDVEANHCYDVVFWQKSSELISERLPLISIEKQQQKPWSSYSNNPLQTKLSQKLVPQLRNSLEQVLPQYMVPSVFVMLGALPLTPNGKVDRKKLPNPNINNRANTEYVVPKTEIEQSIAKIWQDVLQIEKVGIYDNFFEVGGNSLLLVQVSSKLQELFKMGLQVVELLKYPNIYYLSQYIKSETPETKNLTEVREARDYNLKEGKKNMQQRLERRQRHRSKNNVRE